MDPVRMLVFAERAIFAFVGLLFFVAAFTLGLRSVGELAAIVSAPQYAVIAAGTAFLDSMLLVLMIVELAYTVILSLRGAVLNVEPFLLVGLIGVIRRMLVITVGDVGPNPRGGPAVSGVVAQPLELGILTGIVLALVCSIVVLRRTPHDDLGIGGERVSS